jgi:hypothetical protein
LTEPVIVQIPRSIKSATAALNGIDSLLTAKGWERAAIVYAFTYDTGGGRPKSDGNPSLLTITEFSKLGIAGLSHRETVATYRKFWKDYADQPDIKPGSKVTLPTIKFPPTDERGSTRWASEDGAENVLKGMVEKHGAEKVADLLPREAAPIISKALDERDEAIAAADLEAHLGREPKPSEVDSAVRSARGRAVKTGSTVAEETPRAAEFTAGMTKASERDKDARRVMLSGLALEVDDLLDKAYKRLLDALALSRDVSFTGDAQVVLSDTLAKVRGLIGLMEMAVNGTAEVDWDAELAALTE